MYSPIYSTSDAKSPSSFSSSLCINGPLDIEGILTEGDLVGVMLYPKEVLRFPRPSICIPDVVRGLGSNPEDGCLAVGKTVGIT